MTNDYGFQVHRISSMECEGKVWIPQSGIKLSSLLTKKVVIKHIIKRMSV